MLLEIQRLCPVVPLGVPHGTTKEILINKKWVIPKGSMIMVAHWNLNYDEEQFENPKLFKPNRFLDKDGQSISKTQKRIMPFQVSFYFPCQPIIFSPIPIIIFQIIPEKNPRMFRQIVLEQFL